MNSKRRMHDKITDVVAEQLNYFDRQELIQAWDSYEDVLRRIDSAAHIERYRNDPVFHAKVRSMVASLMIAIDSLNGEEQ